MNLVYARDRQATPKLTTFIDFIVERFGPTWTPATTAKHPTETRRAD
jgi:hypothetical protein